jgi:hypothetical protein
MALAAAAAIAKVACCPSSSWALMALPLRLSPRLAVRKSSSRDTRSTVSLSPKYASEGAADSSFSAKSGLCRSAELAAMLEGAVIVIYQ